MGDALLIVGCAALVAAAFLSGLILGLVAVALVCIVGGLALSDGKGFKWRS